MSRTILLVQVADPVQYPPLVHAGELMAEAGWRVTYLTSPVEGARLGALDHPGITVICAGARPSHVVKPIAYIGYALQAVRLALKTRPSVIYASDPLGSGPGWLAAKLSGAVLVYHEHDAPGASARTSALGRFRRRAAGAAALVIVPNEARGRLAQEELGFSPAVLRIVWNLPRRSEVTAEAASKDQTPLVAYFHGSIGPSRLPRAVAQALLRLEGAVVLRVQGYEAPGSVGYMREMTALATTADGRQLLHYGGEVTRADLLAQTAKAHVGLAFMPLASDDVNMRHMEGASNKAFEYMACGLALLVSDLPAWKTMFVTPGYGLACDPEDAEQIAQSLSWMVEHSTHLKQMSAEGRRRIEHDWNYDTAFRKVMDDLGLLSEPKSRRRGPVPA